MGKIILFYKYVNILYPQQIRDWQKGLCTSLGLKGRVLIAQEGINATLGGTEKAIARYISETTAHELFVDLDIKFSDGAADHFPKLRVVVRPEIVNSGIPKHITADMGGKHLTPAQVHELINNKPENLVLLDARNSYESAVGTFKDAIKPPIKNFRDLPGYIDENADVFTGKQVLMFCTGGIRCERASAYLKSKNVSQEVYQILGGIHRYIEQYPDGHFRGKNYVFDGRVLQHANNDVLGTCYFCQIPCDEYANCINAVCNLQFIACATCRATHATELTDAPPVAQNIATPAQHTLASFALCCSPTCKELVQNNKVPVRTKAHKVALPKGSACSI